MQRNEAEALISVEYLRACHKFKKFNTAHEGIAVILEEYRELEKEVFKKKRDLKKMQKEAVQIGAMALRFLTDCCIYSQGELGVGQQDSEEKIK